MKVLKGCGSVWEYCGHMLKSMLMYNVVGIYMSE